MNQTDFLNLPESFRPNWVVNPRVERGEFLTMFFKQIWPCAWAPSTALLRRLTETAPPPPCALSQISRPSTSHVSLGCCPSRVLPLHTFTRPPATDLKSVINSSLASVRPAALSRLEVAVFSLGKFAPVVQGITYHCPREGSFWLDLDVRLGGDVDLELAVGAQAVSAAVMLEDLTITGTLRLQMEPMVALTPWFKNLRLSFVRPPEVDFDLATFSRMLNVMAVPGLQTLVLNAVRLDALAFMCYPNAIDLEIIGDKALMDKGLPVPGGPSTPATQPALGSQLAGVLTITFNRVDLDLEAAARRASTGADAGARGAASDLPLDPAAWRDLSLQVTVGSTTKEGVLVTPNTALRVPTNSPYRFVLPHALLGDYVTITLLRKQHRALRASIWQPVGDVRLPVAAVLTPDGQPSQNAGAVSCTTTQALPLAACPDCTLRFTVAYLPFVAAGEAGSAPSTPPASSTMPPAVPSSGGAAASGHSPAPRTLRERQRLKGGPQEVSSVRPARTGGPAQRGVLVVRVESAANLRRADVVGWADPYVILRVGADEQRTRVVPSSKAPTWNEEFEFLVEDSSVAQVLLDVMDYDKASTDDPLGNLAIPVADITSSQSCALRGEWPLENTPSGHITLAFGWRALGQ